MFTLFSRLDWFFKSHKKPYLIALISLIFIDIFILVPPMLVGLISDGIKASTLSYKTFITLVSLLFILSLINYLLGYLADYHLFSNAYSAMHEIRKKIMEKLIKQNPFFYHHHSSGEIMARSTSDVSSIGDYTGFGIMTLMDSTFYPLIILLLMLRISWQLTLISILPFPLLILASKYLEDKIDESFSAAQKSTDKLSAMVLAHGKGLRVLRAYVQEDRQEEIFGELSKELMNHRNDVSKYVSLFNLTTRAIPGLSYFLAMGLSSYLMAKNQLSLGSLISINLYLGMLAWPMMAFGEYMAVNQQAITSWNRIEDLLNFDDEPLPEGDGEIPGNIISFSQVNFKYSESQGIEDISLELEPGKHLGLVGPIGSGKTTLMKQLLAIYPIPEGLTIDGTAFKDLDLGLYRQGLGYVPQEHVLFSKTLKENITLGEDGDDILEVLERAGFLTDLKQMPEGVNTLLGENGINLSGGQRQRLSLARALYRNPKLLLLDDTLSAVDNLTQSKIEMHLKNLPQDTSLVIISHRLSAVRNCSEILVMDQGRISERGSHEELMKNKGWYYDQWLKQGGSDEKTPA
ncbi:MAG: ABC transporter ATP-binding protein [Tissierellia bacterium]|nr:ABC transporter ATP-binding protein [Tissierellia bacterium]